MIIKILPPENEVVEVVSRWIFSEWSHLDPHVSFEALSEELRKRAESRDIPLTLVAFDGDKPVGTASLVNDDLDSRPHLRPWLANVFVHPSFRSQGIGAALCRQVVEEAKRLGLRKIYLYTSQQQELYSSLGWIKSEEAFLNEVPISIMKRLLNEHDFC